MEVKKCPLCEGKGVVQSSSGDPELERAMYAANAAVRACTQDTDVVVYRALVHIAEKAKQKFEASKYFAG